MATSASSPWPAAIPYENNTLPGYFYRAGEPGVPRPTVIMHTGFDGTAEEMHFQGAAAGAERGYHVLAFDGPGRAALSTASTWCSGPTGRTWSARSSTTPLPCPASTAQGSRYGAEHGRAAGPARGRVRAPLAAVIAVDGAYDQGQTVRAGAGDVPGLERRLRAGADPELDAQQARQMQASPVMRWAMEQAQWAFGVPTPRQACAAFLDYHLRDGIAEKIACPALICAASGLFFVGQARQLFDYLTCPKTFLKFTADEGADAHCQACAERPALARICNWLDDTLGAPDQHTRTGDQNR